MSTTSTTGLRRRPRDSDDDVDTRVFPRRPTLGLDRAMVLQIMHDLDLHAPVETGARPLSMCAIAEEPNVFLTSSSTDAPAPWAQRRQRVLVVSSEAPQPVRRRSKLRWVVFAMCFAIAFGVFQDPVLRRQAATRIWSAAIHAYHYVDGLVRG